MGGLGNQLFQYAVGRHLAIKNGTQLVFDTTAYIEDVKRVYSLGNFKIVGDVSTVDFAKATMPLSFKDKLFYKGPKLTTFNEKYFQFDPEVLQHKDNQYLNGYWQSYKYFDDIRPQILEEFALKEALSPEDEALRQEIANCNSVCLHVRRGDYVASSVTNQYHGTCSPEYYTKGVEIIKSKFKDPHFYVFSDDIAWATENIIPDKEVKYVDHGAAKDFVDFTLMHTCKHFITANSSFSWWAAWLANNEGKTVITPEKWFNDSPNDTKDLRPENWLKI